MSFDEQLRTAFETLLGRLHDDIARELRATTDELAAAARSERERVSAGAAEAARVDADRDADARIANVAVATETRMAQAVAAAEARVREQAEEHAREAIDAAVAAARADLRAVEPAASERLAGAIRAIDSAVSIGGTLDVLVSCAGREAARVALLLVASGELRGWQFVGFGPGFVTARDVVVPMAEAGIVRDAIRKGDVALGDSDQRAAPSFAKQVPGGRSIAIPIVIGGQAVAVLYADQGAAGAEGRLTSTWWDTIEILTRHATRCLEATVAFSAARLLTDRPEAEAASPAGVAEREFTSDEDEAARRYARLLVSEIKLYHEADVIVGRRERDLRTRVGAEIDRARVLYEERVPPQLRLRTDYFQAELVRTLADGDPSLLEVGGQ